MVAAGLQRFRAYGAGGLSRRSEAQAERINLDGNSPVGFHQPMGKAAVAEIHRARARARTAA